MKNYVLIMAICLMSLSTFSSCYSSEEINDGDGRPAYSGKIILDWNLIALESMGGEGYQLPLVNSRINAMMHIAMHDALNAVLPKYEKYAYKGSDKSVDAIAAVAAAAHAVLLVHFPEREAVLHEKLALYLDDVKDGAKKDAGIALGKAVAAAVIATRANDGAFADPVGMVDAPAGAGVYQVLPPYNFAYAEFWKTMKPFSLESPQQFRSKPFPALNSKQYANDFEEVKKIGRLNGLDRTDEQALIAKYWYELSEMGWNRVARIVSEDKKLDLHTTARLFALLDIAMADAYIAGWDSKYHYNFWRPLTAIRAEDDGNDQTITDNNWEPAEPTPPVPDYPSTHSALANAAATVLTYVVGNDVPFSMRTSTAVPAEIVRTFKNFHHAANENAESRVTAGIHFRSACKAGQQMGNEVGAWVIANKLRPLR
ncbi:hypothetical protein C900_04316 [Fulvivirga imtechensis AK7]|uniref:Phosphatidic acid phosphatase type 2/haloperoxidase domain-containing protein n=1 Tax=Fulvivirga imtechensis AK7 TaxID=1237149 RepID=L8K0K7_9BACT|nr:vanadium-dependent haloperoxidase [Fulvivirga imtechensis]ELR73464.1 hypothetical protein C900_04316 [Fulvivirga imtechensis AK7]